MYALAINFGLLEGTDRERAGDRLAAVADNGFRIATGFAGTPFVTDALTDTGHLDDAYRILLERGCPSWLYPVTMGATTVWERWDSMLPDGTINPGEMTSSTTTHSAQSLTGCDAPSGGWPRSSRASARSWSRPVPADSLTWAETEVDTPHGVAEVRWPLREGSRAQIRVPPGNQASRPAAEAGR